MQCHDSALIFILFLLQDDAVATTEALNLTAPPRDLDRKRIDEFTISADLAHGRYFHVEGEAVSRFAQMTNWSYYESLLRFQKVLEVSGKAPLAGFSSSRNDGLVFIDWPFHCHL